jgi:myotubularin-related protein 1/2
MGLPNIHNIRYSFHQLRQLLNSGTDPTYLQTLQSTLWLQNIAQLFTATERCLNSLCSEGTYIFYINFQIIIPFSFIGVSVLVHCSDGWDRTAQIVSLCMLIADPYYRTFDGLISCVIMDGLNISEFTLIYTDLKC